MTCSQLLPFLTPAEGKNNRGTGGVSRPPLLRACSPCVLSLPLRDSHSHCGANLPPQALRSGTSFLPHVTVQLQDIYRPGVALLLKAGVHVAPKVALSEALAP